MKKIMAYFVSLILLTSFSALAAGPLLAQQNKSNATSTIAGTWNMTLMSHQVALEIKQDGKKVTGTLMMPGRDVPVEGEYVEGVLTFSATGGEAGSPQMKFEGKLQEDGTLAGEMVSPRGKAQWTAERLKKRN